jgi:hypothetical protein
VSAAAKEGFLIVLIKKGIAGPVSQPVVDEKKRSPITGMIIARVFEQGKLRGLKGGSPGYTGLPKSAIKFDEPVGARIADV